jgi:hypothetical protein
VARPKTGGRKAGTPNKVTGQLKEMILAAAEEAGGEDGTIGYLRKQALENPTVFMTLLGRVLPHTVAGDAENPIQIDAKVSDAGFKSLAEALGSMQRAATGRPDGKG